MTFGRAATGRDSQLSLDVAGDLGFAAGAWLIVRAASSLWAALSQKQDRDESGYQGPYVRRR